MRHGTVILLLLSLAAAFAFTPARRGNELLIDGQPTALTFARGCDAVADVPAYRAVGFNTLLVRVDSPAPAKLDYARALMDAARDAGLYVLLELVPGNWTMERRAALNDEEYADHVAYFLDTVIPELKDHPRVIGWLVSTVREGQLVSDVGTFNAFLRDKYGTVKNLCDAWSTAKTLSDQDTRVYRARVPSFEVLTERNAVAFDGGQAGIRQHIVADVQAYQQSVHARDADFQRYLRARYPSIERLNAEWNFQFEAWDSVRVATLLKRQEQRGDPSPLSMLEYARYQATLPRELLAWWAEQVRARDPRGLLFAGGQYRYRTLATVPPAYHGIYAECYPGTVEPDLEHHAPHAIDLARRGNRFIVLAGILAERSAPPRCVNYLYEAALHGAAGVGVYHWQTLAQSPGHAAAVAGALADLAARRLLGRVPRPTAAFVYSPYPLGPATLERPLYGYLQGYVHFGPGLLFFTFRNGTCYGQFDYLAPEDLPLVPLARYQALLLPAVLDFPDAAQDALIAYVRHGGTAVADLSLGMLQMKGNNHYLPAKMQELFGVINTPGLRPVRLNLEVYREHPRFPLLLQGLRSTGVSNGLAIGQAARAIPLAGTDLLCTTTPSRTIQRPTPRLHRPLEAKPITGIFIRRHEHGVALYAPFPLYQYWASGSMLFDEFHRNLFGAGVALEMERPMDFLPSMASAAAFADGIALWTRDRTLPRLRITNPARRLFATQAGSCVLEPNRTIVTGDTAGYHIIEALPVTVDPAPFAVRVADCQQSKQAFTLDLGAADEDAGKSLILRVSGGAYAIAPGSRHRVTLVTEQAVKDFTITADARGVLVLSLPAARCRVLLGGADTIVEPQPTPATDGELVIDADPL